MKSSMQYSNGDASPPANMVRSIFVSDIHLGSRFARVDRLLDLLSDHTPAYLYLVGDIVDGWCLKRRWHWPESYDRLLKRLLELANEGTIIRLTPGNHDEFLRRFLLSNDLVTIRNEFVHEVGDSRKLLVLHGDIFDTIERNAPWLCWIGGAGYEIVMRVDHWCNRLLDIFGFRRRRISQTIKQRVKLVVQFVSGFENRAINYARQSGCDIVVCGHIHYPTLCQSEDVLYINLGDWIENGTALVEHFDGALQLIDIDLSTPLGESPSQLNSTHQDSVMYAHPAAASVA